MATLNSDTSPTSNQPAQAQRDEHRGMRFAQPGIPDQPTRARRDVDNEPFGGMVSRNLDIPTPSNQPTQAQRRVDRDPHFGRPGRTRALDRSRAGELTVCRHLVYLGEPLRLSRLLYEPPHSLCHQAFQPKDMRGGGTINADGFGVGWFAGDTVLRHRRATPIWSDSDWRRQADVIEAATVLAAVRSATVGMPVTEGASAPFTDGRWLFSLNGRIDGWPHSMAKMAAELPVTELMTADAPTDAAFLWTLLRHRLRDNPHPANAVSGLVREVAAAAPASRLNLLLTDGVTVVATTWWHALSVRRDASGVTIASEPLDADPAWRPIGDRKLVTASATAFGVSDLDY